MSAETTVFDLFIIGGGINGCGIARDAAGRRLSVCLVEQGDFASATSQWSTKLIHGGLRYLEYYEFRLVAESLREREVLLKVAPHLIQPLEFILPHEPHLRPRWMIAAGMLLYDMLGGKKSTPRSKSVRLTDSPLSAGLKPHYTYGFSYYDARADDARLTLANARGAADLGATVLPRTKFIAAAVREGVWHVEVQDAQGARVTYRAKMLVNAGGPWVARLLRAIKGVTQKAGVKHVRGSHIVVPRIHEGEHAYILQNPDQRIIFIIPYQGAYSLIGTTDSPVDEFVQPKITPEEIDYLCRAASAYTAKPVKPEHVVWTYSGVRPLYDDGGADAKAITRDYVLEMNLSAGAPLLNVFGGKLTTFRRLAEHALEKMQTHFPRMGPAWTHAEPLPGGDFEGGLPALVAEIAHRHPYLPGEHVPGIARRHGSTALRWLGNANSIDALGEYFGAGLYECEISHMRTDEWALTAEDVLWRRSKCGLIMSGPQRERVAEYLSLATAKKAA
ncbi:MAG TPA: glycerol-3-phosphate dehydrogenase [Burkholderiales bacterium]|nr:glycerol-3-phosphate dehydrogenase [Burkholderiales bacterium]